MLQRMMRARRFRQGLGTILLFGLLPFTAGANAGSPPEQQTLKKIRVNGVELHYLDQGTGEPVIFVHGALADYRRWEAQVVAFAQHYRMIAYSRRYNFPNNNPDIRPDHSADVEAHDLAAFITALKLGPVHVIGESMGASAALRLAVQHPELVRTLVLAEPPEHRWANDMPSGPAVFDEFIHSLWEPVGQAFRDGDPERALRLSMDFFITPGIWDELPDDVKDGLRANQRDWQALTTSNDSFPLLSRADVQKLRVPTLMLTGGKTLPIHHLVNDELERLLPGRERVRLPEASHEMWVEFPELCREITFAFLAKQRISLPETGEAGAPLLFTETDFSLDGEFAAYWTHNGALPVFGYPIDSARQDPQSGNPGRVSQWLERARFELHLENAAPGGPRANVLLGRLGAELLERQGRSWQSLPKGRPTAPHYFAATGHAIAPQFWDTWQTHGLEQGDRGMSERESLALFGYPISEPQMETNSSGARVLTQWFERARFEYHAGRPIGSQVMFGRIGDELKQLTVR